jgi:protein-tyrosine phosphatase
MAIFSWIRSNTTKEAAPIGNLQVDVHSHLIPGIDDGAQTMEHTIGMINRFYEMGYRKLIITPHVMAGVYENTSEIILNGFQMVQDVVSQMELPIELEVSAEYFLDETFFEKVKNKELLPFKGNHILFECSFRYEPQQLDEIIFLLCSKGYQPIIAHFERYFYYHGNLDRARRLRELGCWIQVNLNSFTGHYGPDVRKQAIALHKAGLIDIAGSDCHRIEHLDLLQKHLNQKEFHELLASPLKNSQLK